MRIMYARYVPMVLTKISRIFLLVKEELQNLFDQSFPQLQNATVNENGDKLSLVINLTDKFAHCPLSQLPYLFKTTLDTIPTDIPYITASKKSDLSYKNWLVLEMWSRSYSLSTRIKINSIQID